MVDPKEYIYIAEADKLIIVYREADKPKTDQVVNFFDYLDELADKRKFHMIIDLSRASAPSAAVRHEFKKRFKALEDRVESYSIFFGKNFLLKITAKFVGASIGLENFKTRSSIQNAIEHIANNAD